MEERPIIEPDVAFEWTRDSDERTGTTTVVKELRYVDEDGHIHLLVKTGTELERIRATDIYEQIQKGNLTTT